MKAENFSLPAYFERIGNVLKTVTRGETSKRTVAPEERDLILADWFGLAPDA